MLNSALVLRIHLFAGPSLDADTVRIRLAELPCEWSLDGPVQQGDVLRLLDEPPQVIAIVDGYFQQVPAVLHKEILLALEMGIRVLGAASMGALRAAELHPYGMEGVGEIFRWYREGVVDGDDEVALLHAPAELAYRKLTEPLVNVRYNLLRAQAANLISQETAGRLLAVARRIHYANRDWDRIVEEARSRQVDAESLRAWQEFVRREAVDLKRRDAEQLVELIAARVRGSSPWPDAARVEVARSRQLHVFQRDYTEVSLDGGRRLRESQVVDLERIASPRFDRFNRRVAHRCLLVEEARHRGMEQAGEEELLARFQRVREMSPGQLDDWMRWNGLTLRDLIQHLQDMDLAHRVLFPAGGGSWNQGRDTMQRILRDLSGRHGIPEHELTSPLCMRPGIPWEGPLLRTMKVQGRFRRAWMRAERIEAWHQRQWQNRSEAAEVYDALFTFARPSVEQWVANHWGVAREQLAAQVHARGFATYEAFLRAARLLHDHEIRPPRSAIRDQSAIRDSQESATVERQESAAPERQENAAPEWQGNATAERKENATPDRKGRP